MSDSLTPAPIPRAAVAPLENGARGPLPPDRAPRDDDAGIPWGRYWQSVRRHRYLVLAVLVAGTALGLLLTRVISPVYEAHGTIWISPESSPTRAATGPIRGEEILNATSWPDLLKSFAILDRVVIEERRYLEPGEPRDSVVFASFDVAQPFTPGSYELEIDEAGRQWVLREEERGEIERGAVGDSIGRRAGFRWQPAAARLGRDRTIEFTLVPPRDAALALREQLSDSLPEGSNLLRATLRGTDPAATASTMNSIVRQTVEAAAELKRRNLIEFSRELEGQLGYAQGELRDAESRLRAFGERAVTQPWESATPQRGIEMTRSTVRDRFFDQRAEQAAVSQDRQAMQRVLGEIQAGTGNVDAFWTIGSVQTSAPDLRTALTELSTKEAELRALRQTYTNEYKPVRDLQRITNELRTQTIPQLARELIAQLQTRERDLNRRLASASGELRGMPARAIEEARLRRDVEVRENLYKMLQSRYEEAKVSEASAIPDITVLDTAVVPQRPAANTAPRIILGAILFSLALGIIAALLRDQMDSRLRYPEQITDRLGLRILGAVPELRGEAGSAHSADEYGQLHEAFRTLRLAVSYAMPAGQPIRFVVSSPGAGEGKSLVCENLALTFAEAGYDTLLIDGDIRRGRLDTTFGVERRPGLLDFLQGDASLEESLRPTTHHRLTLMPSGTRRHEGPEILMSPALNRLVTDVLPRYQVVIVDSAPLAAGTDPYVLGTALGHMVLVLRHGVSDLVLAESKLKTLSRLPVRVHGAVLNGIAIDSHDRQYGYLEGYGVIDEDRPDRTLTGSSAGST